MKIRLKEKTTQNYAYYKQIKIIKLFIKIVEGRIDILNLK